MYPTSPEFKGIKTYFKDSLHRCVSGYPTSPEFKGIKTGAAELFVELVLGIQPALNSKGLRLTSERTDHVIDVSNQP